MTVGELSEKLARLNPALPVFVVDVDEYRAGSVLPHVPQGVRAEIRLNGEPVECLLIMGKPEEIHDFVRSLLKEGP